MYAVSCTTAFLCLRPVYQQSFLWCSVCQLQSASLQFSYCTLSDHLRRVPNNVNVPQYRPKHDHCTSGASMSNSRTGLTTRPALYIHRTVDTTPNTLYHSTDPISETRSTGSTKNPVYNKALGSCMRQKVRTESVPYNEPRTRFSWLFVIVH